MAIVFTDDPCQYRRPGEVREITGYVELLQELEVFDPALDPHAAPTPRQREAISGWLEVHRPTDILAVDLHQHGVTAAPVHA